MAGTYRNPPIVEVICDFRFRDDTQWDETVADRYFDFISDGYPKKTAVSRPRIERKRGKSGRLLKPKLMHEKVVRFSSESGAEVVQIGRRLLVVNQLSPYPSWSNYRPRVEHGLTSLGKVIRDPVIERFGLRYVNKIEIRTEKPAEDIVIGDYFNIHPHAPGSLASHGPFIAGVQVPFEGEREYLRVQIVRSEMKEPGTAVRLDIEYGTLETSNVSIEKALEAIDVAHERVGRAFEDCITDKTRGIFGVQTSGG